MILNLAQKYAAVVSAFVNTVLIIKFLDLEKLGLYAFVTAGANIYAVFVTGGLRSVYLREIVKYRNDLENQRVFTIFAEIQPKLVALIVAGLFLSGTWLISIGTENAVYIAIVGSLLASLQLTSQKLRSHGLNTLSQVVLNARPILFTVLLLSVGLMSPNALQTHFEESIVLSFAAPAAVAYLFWLVRHRTLVFSAVSFSAVIARAGDITRELPGLFMLAFGQIMIARSDVILVTGILSLEAAGIYRVARQIVTVSNSSLTPIQSQYLRQYSRLLGRQKSLEAEAVARKVARFGMPLYLAIYGSAFVVLYLAPYLDSIKYRPEFIWSLAILGIVGLVKAGVPMIENYVVYRNNTNRGGLIRLGIVFGNVAMHSILIPLLGLPGACLTSLLSTICWVFAIKKFL